MKYATYSNDDGLQAPSFLPLSKPTRIDVQALA